MLAVLLKIKAVLLLHFARTVSALLLDGAASRALPVGFFSCLQWWSQGAGGARAPPYHLGFYGSPPTNFIEEGENFEEEEEGIR